MLAIVVKFFVLSECVSVCMLFFFSMGHVPEINGDDDMNIGKLISQPLNHTLQFTPMSASCFAAFNTGPSSLINQVYEHIKNILC